MCAYIWVISVYVVLNKIRFFLEQVSRNNISKFFKAFVLEKKREAAHREQFFTQLFFFNNALFTYKTKASFVRDPRKRRSWTSKYMQGTIVLC